MKYYFSLGSNLGNRKKNLLLALKSLQEEGINLLQVSSLYETQPVDLIEQPWFLNCSLIGETSLFPQDILDVVLKIEKNMGRQRNISKGPRLIDIDILFVENRIIKTSCLTVPHPRLQNRNFVLVPLAEIASEKIHPILNKTIKELLFESSDRSLVYPLGPFWPGGEQV